MGGKAVKPTAKVATPKPPVKAAAKPVARSAARTKVETIAVFIDLDNTNASITNIEETLSILKGMGRIAFGKFYGYTDDRVSDFGELVYENKFETAGKLRFKTDGVSVIDTRLFLESIDLCQKNRYDMVFIWTGVGDLIPLFARLRESGAKTLTIELPEFDHKNKFVDQAIKLYSPHGLITKREPIPHQAAPPPPPVIPDKPRTPPAKTTTQGPPELDLAKVPLLPRKKGAPEFGVKEEHLLSEEIEDDEETDMSPEEFKRYLLEIANDTFEQTNHELAKVREATRQLQAIGEVGPTKTSDAPPALPKKELVDERLEKKEKLEEEDWIPPIEDDPTDKYEHDGNAYDSESSATLKDDFELAASKVATNNEFNDFGDFGNLANVPSGEAK